MINLSLGGVRDPDDPSLDTLLAAEQAAVEYAYSKGVVVVAAVGNGDGVADDAVDLRGLPGGAAARDRRRRAAPGRVGPGLLEPRRARTSTSRRRATRSSRRSRATWSTRPGPTAPASPYSTAGPFEFRERDRDVVRGAAGRGRRRAAARRDPTLPPDQVAWLLERTAADVNAATGCPICAAGRDSLTGWGRLDVARRARARSAAAARCRRADRYEPNDDAGTLAHRVRARRARSPRRSTTGTTRSTSTRSRSRQGERAVRAALAVEHAAPTALVLWKPGTPHVTGSCASRSPNRGRALDGVGGQQRLALHRSRRRAPTTSRCS